MENTSNGYIGSTTVFKLIFIVPSFKFIVQIIYRKIIDKIYNRVMKKGFSFFSNLYIFICILTYAYQAEDTFFDLFLINQKWLFRGYIIVLSNKMQTDFGFPY